MISTRLLAAVSALLLTCLAGASARADIDYGDSTSATLAGKAWKASEGKDYEAVKAYAGKCRELYEAEAVKMQAGLKEPASKDTANEYWALNDVGTCLFILGQAQEASGDKKGALETYNFLVSKLAFAQCWDPKGWFWKPADAAKGKLAALEFDAASEAPAPKKDAKPADKK